MAYQYFMPAHVKCGPGIAAQLGEELRSRQYHRLFVITDEGIVKAGLFEQIEHSLAACGITYSLFDQVEPNPSSSSIEKALALLDQDNCDAVLAVGGGSSMDTAKAVAVMAGNEGRILDYEGVGKLPRKGLPLVAVPTTAGTGSEATASTIITNEMTSFKTAVISPYLYPELAVLDPLLTIGLPPSITAATGMDALTHAIESFTSKGANPVSSALAIEAIRMIGEHLTKAYFVGTDLKSRENMLVASLMAGIAFAQSRLGNVHAISHTFGGIFNIPHGIANATLLPYVMRFNLPACPEKMKVIAGALGRKVEGMSVKEAAEQAIEAVKDMNRTLHIPDNIKDLGVSLDFLSKMVEDSMRSGNVLINPRLTRAEDIQAIIERAYHGQD